MATTFVIRRNDQLPSLTATLLDAENGAVNLTGATVRFHMRARGAAAPKVDAAADILDAAAGRVTYNWDAGDTDTVGRYDAEFEVTWPDARAQSFPNIGHIVVTITEDVA